MFDLTSSEEFMAAARAALVLAFEQTDLASKIKRIDPDNDWLTTSEVLAFLRVSLSALKRLRKAHPEWLVVSYALGAREPRYQLTALQQMMSAPVKLVGANAEPSKPRAVSKPAAVTTFQKPAERRGAKAPQGQLFAVV